MCGRSRTATVLSIKMFDILDNTQSFAVNRFYPARTITTHEYGKLLVTSYERSTNLQLWKCAKIEEGQPSLRHHMAEKENIKKL